MHGLDAGGVLVALSWPWRGQVQALLVVAVPFLDISG